MQHHLYIPRRSKIPVQSPQNEVMSVVEHRRAELPGQAKVAARYLPLTMIQEAPLEELPFWPGNTSPFSFLLMGAMVTTDGHLCLSAHADTILVTTIVCLVVRQSPLSRKQGD